MEKAEMDAIKARDAATAAHHLAGDQSVPWKRVLLDRRALLAHIAALETPREREHEYLASRCWCGEANYPKSPHNSGEGKL